MKRIFLLLGLALSLAACACGSKEVQPEPQPQPQPEPKKETEEGELRVPLTASITKVQPLTGIVIWTDNSARTQDYVQLEYCYMQYNKVCKGQDDYDWTSVDRLLADVASRGHQAVLRFYYVYPGKKCTVPDYIKNWPGYEASNGKAEGRSTEYPDWRCEELQRFHLEFYRLFAQRYDLDARLAYLETGFGHWAEYHVFEGLFIEGQTFPSKEFQSEFLTAMDVWFAQTPWLISIDAADGKYAPFKIHPELKDLGFGNFDDSFMCEQWDSENGQNWQFFGTSRYKKAPLGGEFSYYDDNGDDYDQKHALDKKGMYGRTFEQLAAKVHMTFIIGNDQPHYQKTARIKEAALALGYRFQIRDFLVKEGEYASVRIANVGIAPIYYDAFVEVEGVKGELNLRNLMPGQEQTVKIPCVATLDSRPSISCDRLVKGQKIEYEADFQ